MGPWSNLFCLESRGTEARAGRWQILRRHHDRWHTGSAGK